MKPHTGKVEDAAFKWQAPKTKECEKRAATFRNKVSGSVRIVWDGIVMVHAFDKDEHYYIGEETLWTLIETKGTMAQSQPDLPPPYICISLKQEVACTKKNKKKKQEEVGTTIKSYISKSYMVLLLNFFTYMTKPNIFMYTFSLVLLG